jgi:hypothetical protein
MLQLKLHNALARATEASTLDLGSKTLPGFDLPGKRWGDLS